MSAIRDNHAARLSRLAAPTGGRAALRAARLQREAAAYASLPALRGGEVRCWYCGSGFAPARSDARTCSSACRQMMRRALRAVELWPPSLGAPDTERRYYSSERAARTGYGGLTASEKHQADRRVRHLVTLLVVLAHQCWRST